MTLAYGRFFVEPKAFMTSSFTHTSSLTKIIIIVEIFFVAYLIYSLTKNVYSFYRVDNYIESFQSENQEIETENKAKTEDYLYFTSEEYIDKIAKQNLGLVNPGEEVIILSEDVLSEEILLSEDELPDHARYSGEPVSDQWWNLFFAD